ncbi:hypothetical protein FRX31_034212 [Thalictrum thalictroides]|uniref:Uncharacterized protein n=1 Tax=Thalictrum thalictroides TaxID=46969 RepID=A0A7J6UUT1_THATH|nr:hypothetical protein FRX31_034212 [Thalictrum thalictroides]
MDAEQINGSVAADVHINRHAGIIAALATANIQVKPVVVAAIAAGQILAPTRQIPAPAGQIHAAAVLPFVLDNFLTARSLPNTTKIEQFQGDHFKRWKERVFDALDVLNFA